MLNIQTPINNLGYGVAGYNILRELYEIDKTICLYPIGQPEQSDEFIQHSLQNISNLALDRPFVKIWHQHDLTQRIGSGKYFGFPIFELDKFSQQEKISIKHCDEVLVCSKWAASIVESETRKKASVVPLGVDNAMFCPVKFNNSPKTIFFNCGKWEKRKGHDVILECFNKAFTSQDNVELWMMCTNPFIGDDNAAWQKLYKTSGLGDKIRLIPRQQRHQDVARLMNMADCGLFPARAEGWNLELLEMMACGKHVIATNYSAHTEFCTPVNSRLINVDNLETAFDGVFFDGSKGFWAELAEDQKDAIIHHMRDIHSLKQSGSLVMNDNGIETANKFTWKNSVNALLGAMNG